tara:strand:+ start:512 stop:1120 length:609 start_codon:yes stop_codon:yes gene_type:complete
MKKIKFTSVMLIALGLSFSITACGGSNNSDQSHSEIEHTHEAKDMDHDESAHNEMNVESKTSTEVVNHYLAIKNALVEDNKDGAIEAANDLVAALSELEMKDLSESDRNEMTELVEVIKEHGEHIAKSPIDHQREHFVMLSNDMVDFVDIAGFEQTLYKQYCPMFENGKGGSWLSSSEEIRNPLFGSKMLKCGSVKETISSM